MAPAASVPARVLVTHPQPVADDEESYPSNLYVERDVRLTARRSGLIEKVLVERGDTVREGQTLCVVEKEAATSELAMTESERNLAQAEHDRALALNREHWISAQELLLAETAKTRANIRHDLAQIALARCELKAPFDGTIVERWAVVGQRVTDDADAPPLFRVAARDPLRARLNLPEEKMPGIAPGARSWIISPGSQSTHPARVVFVGPAIDPGSGTVPVIVEAIGRLQGLGLGSSVRVRLESRSAGGAIRTAPPAVRLPRRALPPGGVEAGSEGVLLIAARGRAEERKVRVVSAAEETVVVRGEVGPKDAVILRGETPIEKGDAVEVREER